MHKMKSPARALSMATLLAMSPLATADAAEARVERPGYVLQADAQGDGPVTVVFESGFGQGGGVWKDVVADLGAQCRCITYARAGLGKSGTDGKPKSIEEDVQDLGAVIDTLAPKGKVLLVGHSYGGLLATEFAREHPEHMQGLVLVDPATMAQRHEAMEVDRARVLADDQALLGMLPPNLAADYRELIAQLDSDAAVAPRPPQPDLPVALLTSTKVEAEPFVFEETAAGKALWKRQHAALFAGYMRGVHEYFATGHNIHRENPKAVADAIRYVAGLAAEAPATGGLANPGR
jgi:pimeloyl-ACP methyl ester carboxylesterase